MTEATESPDIYDPHASKRAQIDQQVLLLQQQAFLLQQQIQKLLVERNTLTPISPIPNEIISSIFLLCRGRDHFDKIDTRALLPLSWVCHRWRTIVLSTASLWAYIGYTGKENLRWAEECLTRSKQAPLEINLVARNPLTTAIGVTALCQIHRVRKLALYSSGQSAWNTLRGFLARPAPILETLTLGYADIATPMLSGVSPMLHTVVLQECRISSWNSNTLSLGHLRHLSLERCGDIPVITFIQSLPPSLPHLETLKLYTTLVASPAPTPVISPVHFPNLKSLRLLTRAPSPIIQLFQLCNLPAATELDVHVTMNEGETVLDLVRLLQAPERLHHPPNISMRLYHAVAEDTDGRCTFIIKGLHSPDDENFSFQVIHVWSWSDISRIFHSLPVQKVTTLTLAVPGLTMDDWTNVFAQLIHLEDLVLDDTDTVLSFTGFIVLSADNFKLDDTVTAADVDLPFKSLKSLVLSEYISESVAIDFLRFFTALKIRHDCGLRLQKLCLPEGVFHNELLHEIVDEVIILSG
ncbi:hypothetical protein BDN72DRAFT_95521 [Pluteus cervinus]|uniref:Uncharacterized protein n=1 Tax=Pluteus cervinus TaxID=181527 RepID=A0ACD3AP95_9AGAR|nr:hypothetical protein BDN72DRAFT_95521 [Pluteus cervinus]